MMIMMITITIVTLYTNHHNINNDKHVDAPAPARGPPTSQRAA